MRRRTYLGPLAAAALLALVAACEPALVPAAAPTPPEAGAGPAAGAAPADESRALYDYYKRIEDGLVAQGLLRTDGGGPDTPFSARDLAEDFERIALFEEYANVGGRIVARQTPSRLHRWEVPVRMRVEFGATVPAAQRVADRTNVANYAGRLARITGLSIRQVTADPNFYVFIVNEAERKALGPRIRAIMPGIDEAAVDAVTGMPRSTFCLVFAWDPEDRGSYSQAVAVIRGEHPDLMRLSCIHEELAQGLGLSNDSPKARPSVFNDDEEFGLLTIHDEMLLRMLYDPRMSAGMDAATARAQAEIIARELIGPDS